MIFTTPTPFDKLCPCCYGGMAFLVWRSRRGSAEYGRHFGL